MKISVPPPSVSNGGLSRLGTIGPVLKSSHQTKKLTACSAGTRKRFDTFVEIELHRINNPIKRPLASRRLGYLYYFPMCSRISRRPVRERGNQRTGFIAGSGAQRQIRQDRKVVWARGTFKPKPVS